jgi:hypothetical protein
VYVGGVACERENIMRHEFALSLGHRMFDDLGSDFALSPRVPHHGFHTTDFTPRISRHGFHATDFTPRISRHGFGEPLLRQRGALRAVCHARLDAS